MFVDYNNIASNNGNDNNDGMIAVYENFFKYGFSIIENITPLNDIETSKNLLNSIAPIENTFFGELYEFASHNDLIDTYGDLAYSNEYLPPHTDTTYFYPSVGLHAIISMFKWYCKKDFKNGQSTLTDGFNLLTELWLFYKFKLKSMYLDSSDLYFNDNQFMIGLNSDNSIKYLSWNNDDRANMNYLSNNNDDIMEFYHNYQLDNDIN